MKNQINKKFVQRAFDRASISYEQHANVQLELAQTLMVELKQWDINYKTILDLGCGTGFLTKYISQLNKDGQTIGVDFAANMLLQAQLKTSCENLNYICTDMENLPFQNQCFDVIVANMSLHWCKNLPIALQYITQLLKSNGKLLFTIPGAHSLHELDFCWRSVDHYQHINHFLSSTNLYEILSNNFLEKVKIETMNFQQYFSTLWELLDHFKKIGVTNANAHRAKYLMSTSKLEKLEKCYEAFRKDQGLPVTYEVYYVTAQK